MTNTMEFIVASLLDTGYLISLIEKIERDNLEAFLGDGRGSGKRCP
jgi:hypothetical protein